MDLRAENINWNCPAGKQLDRLASLLPKQPRLDITVFGSAPLQLFLNPDFLSQDIDLYAPEENWDYLAEFVESKDLEAFKLVIAKTGHPTEEEFTKHLQKAVDLYRPKFDEETARGDMMLNTRELWKILWNKEIDVRAAIIRPALARAVHDSEPPDPNLKTRLANLKLPGK